MQSSTDAQSKPVLIVGAGPTGLCLALWLNRLGISFRIIDQASGPGTTSRAIICHARTLEMYQSLGIAEDMISHGSKLQNVTIAQQGQIRGSLKFGNIGTGLSPFPFILSLPQDIHERVLLDHLHRAGVTIERSTTLESLKQHDDGVTARVCGPHSDHEDISASYVAGCDGARSTVRKSCGIKFEGGTYEQKFFVSDVNATGHIPTGDVNISLQVAISALRFHYLARRDIVSLVWFRKEWKMAIWSSLMCSLQWKTIQGLGSQQSTGSRRIPCMIEWHRNSEIAMSSCSAMPPMCILQSADRE